jgi:vacuolar-type H+-ATPase subunit H
MAKETVQAVRQAELNAAQTEREANEKREAILAEAQLNAKTMISSMTKEANEKAERNLTLANERGIELLENAKKKAESEVLLMKEMVQNKGEAAINLILATVIK